MGVLRGDSFQIGPKRHAVSRHRTVYRSGNRFPLGALEPHFDNFVESDFLSFSGGGRFSVASVISVRRFSAALGSNHASRKIGTACDEHLSVRQHGRRMILAGAVEVAGAREAAGRQIE